MIRKHGVGRISINPQTMQQKTLDVIGRRHTVEDVVRIFHLARELGFDNINMDLIAGLPGEHPEEMEDTMNRWQDILDNWEAWNPTCWEPKRNRDFSYTNDVPLMYSAGSHRNEAWGTRGIETPTSMRSVDASCEAEVLSRKYVSKGEE